MKVREVIQEFIPCEICGNNDLKNFYFHILVDKGSQPYVKMLRMRRRILFYKSKKYSYEDKRVKSGKNEIKNYFLKIRLI